MFCSNCGKEIDDNAYVCPHCGVQIDANNKQVVPDNNIKQNRGSKRYAIAIVVSVLSWIIAIGIVILLAVFC